MKKPLIIGITGGIGGGKSMFANLLQERGELVYNTDLEAKKIQDTDKKLIENIKKEFGESIYTNHTLNRAKLAKIVFSDAEKLQKLNSLVHPRVKADFQKWVKKNSAKRFLFMECAILFEGKFEALVDKIVVVTAPEKIRIERVVNRDKISEESVRNRIKNQLQEEEKISRADWVFDTDNDELPSLRVNTFLEILNSIF